MKLKVEKHIPMPEGTSSRSTNLSTTMRHMEVGESFLYPLSKRSSITATLVAVNRYDNTCKKFITRKVSETTLRAWRSK